MWAPSVRSRSNEERDRYLISLSSKVAACAVEHAGRHGYAIGSGRGHDRNLVLVDPPHLTDDASARRACPRGCQGYHFPEFAPLCKFGPPGHRGGPMHRCEKMGGSLEHPADIVGERPRRCDASRLFRQVLDWSTV